jgi:hypothetical protein
MTSLWGGNEQCITSTAGSSVSCKRILERSQDSAEDAGDGDLDQVSGDWPGEGDLETRGRLDMS